MYNVAYYLSPVIFLGFYRPLKGRSPGASGNNRRIEAPVKSISLRLPREMLNQELPSRHNIKKQDLIII
jgi:hypothetical protein